MVEESFLLFLHVYRNRGMLTGGNHWDLGRILLYLPQQKS